MVLVAVPGDARTQGFAAALARAGLPPATLVPWAEVLAEPGRVGAAGQPGELLRVESPGSNEAIWDALARRGGAEGGVPPGQWRPGRAWFSGLSLVLGAIDPQATHLRPTHPSGSILGMTDKREAHRRLADGGVPVPEQVPHELVDPPSFRAWMAEVGWGAAFVKPRWGSSGAGVLAWRRAGARERVVTPAEVGPDGALLNAKRLRTYTDPSTIDRLLTLVLGDGAVVERWIPKAGDEAGPFDLRVLVVDGVITHRIARVGRGPITNLHLGSARADPDRVLASFGPRAASDLHAACTTAAAVFAGHRCVGVDVMVDPKGRPRVLECNAWGDYLPRLWADGLDSYDVQVRALFGADA